MEHARKMVLVPQELAHQVQTNHYHAQAPTYQGLSGLDEEMQSILRRKDIPKDERVKLYQQALVNYINLHHRLNQPMTVKVETQSTSNEPTTMSWSSRVIDSVPKTLKKKAEQLIDIIEQAPKSTLNFNEKGELIVAGKTLEGTHVIDLVNDTLRSRKNFKPKGWQEFTHALANMHPPRELIGNDERWKFMIERRQNPMSRDEFEPDETSVEEKKEVKSMYSTATHLPRRKVQRIKNRKQNRWEPY